MDASAWMKRQSPNFIQLSFLIIAAVPLAEAKELRLIGDREDAPNIVWRNDIPFAGGYG
jgi:hypothetical protein